MEGSPGRHQRVRIPADHAADCCGVRGTGIGHLVVRTAAGKDSAGLLLLLGSQLGEALLGVFKEGAAISFALQGDEFPIRI